MSETVKKRSKSRVSGVDRFLTAIRVLMATLIVIGIVAFIAQQVWPGNPFADWRNPDARGLTGDQFKGLVVSNGTITCTNSLSFHMT